MWTFFFVWDWLSEFDQTQSTAIYRSLLTYLVKKHFLLFRSISSTRVIYLKKVIIVLNDIRWEYLFNSRLHFFSSLSLPPFVSNLILATPCREKEKKKYNSSVGAQSVVSLAFSLSNILLNHDRGGHVWFLNQTFFFFFYRSEAKISFAWIYLLKQIEILSLSPWYRRRWNRLSKHWSSLFIRRYWWWS